MKKLLALTLTLALCLGLCAPALADGPEEGTYFVDGQTVPALTPGELENDEFLSVNIEDLVDGGAVPISDGLPTDINWEEFLAEQEPTLTLVVNGAASEVEVTADNGVSYADAADLRAILGAGAVDSAAEGPTSIRAAAEAAGWTVEWYGGTWSGLYQEVQLWNEAAFLAEVEPQLAGFQTLYDAAMDLTRQQLYTDTPQRTTGTVDLTLTRFSTLDSGKTYTARIQADVLAQKGVVDATLTFHVADLLKLFTAQELAAFARSADFAPADLTALLTGGKVELVLDLNQGAIAFKAPILGLLDETLADWQSVHIPGLRSFLDETLTPDFGHVMFETMTAQAAWGGAVSARAGIDQGLSILAALMGPDTLSVGPGGQFSWNLTTDKVNGLLYDVMASALPGFAEQMDRDSFSLFKKYDISMSMDPSGKVNAKMAMRLDADGIAALALSGDPYADADASTALTSMGTRILLSLLDMELTATETGNMNTGVTETMRLHWNNQGMLELKAQTKVRADSDSPRQVADIEEKWVKQPLAVPQLGVIGGVDGPTAVWTAS